MRHNPACMTHDLHQALHDHFGYPAFRPGQEEALHAALSGRDTLVVMPTGSGKSLIYQLAALILPGTALIVSPLVALMKDQVDGLARRGIAATFINSSLDAGEQGRRLRGLANGAFKLVLVAPERFRSPGFRGALEKVTLSLLAVDEAHCLSQWGHDFRPDYLYLAEARRWLNPPVTLALTATATPRVQADMIRLLGLGGDAARIVTGFDRPNITFRVVPARNDEVKLRRLTDFLEEAEGAGIVYAGTRREAETVATYLRDVLKRPAEHYHAALDPVTRARVQDAFLSGDLPLVVATNAFGMGIDRPDVRWVFHFSMPGSLEAYYQEAGRAGRDGLPAEAVLAYAPRDSMLHQHFIDRGLPTGPELRQLYDHVRALTDSTAFAEIEAATGLDATKVRVAIDQLVAAGAVRRVDEAGARVRLEAAVLDAARMTALDRDNATRRQHKLDQLERMATYAQAESCRRRMLLAHFADDSVPETPPELCCDVCSRAAEAAAQPTADTSADGTAVNGVGTLSKAERAALIVLDAIRKLGRPLGKAKLAQFLRGSDNDFIASLKDRPYYAKFADLRLKDIESLIEQLLDSGHVQQAGGLRPILALSSLGETALRNKAAIRVTMRFGPAPSAGIGAPPTARARATQAAREAGGTLALTLDLQRRGLTPAQIAAERGLAEGTIYAHLAELIADGKVEIDAVVDVAVQAQIREAIRLEGSSQYLSPLKARLPNAISYGEIRCVVEAVKARARGNA